MKYDLSHLTQEPDQCVLGPIQDDEALLLYAMIRVCGYKRVVEFGRERGYSARNFLAAVGPSGRVYSIDRERGEAQAPNHILIQREIRDVIPSDLDNAPIDLLFVDAHDHDQQLGAIRRFIGDGLILSTTMIALHDTGLHPAKFTESSIQLPAGGWVHQQAERAIVNALQHDWETDCQVISLECRQPEPPLVFRHGLTLFRIGGL